MPRRKGDRPPPPREALPQDSTAESDATVQIDASAQSDATAQADSTIQGTAPPADSTAAPAASRRPPPQSPDPLIPRSDERLLRVLATDSVQVVQRRLTAVADSAVLDRAELPDAEPDAALTDADELDDAPPDTPDFDLAEADSSARAASREQLRLFGKAGGFAGRPRVWSDRLQLTADEVAVDGRAGELDRLRAVGKAFAAQQDSALAREQQIQGPQFEGRLQGGALNRLLVWPNAEAIHFRTDTSGALAGATQLSADSIAFVLAADTLRAVRAYRGIEGTYYDADLVPPDLRLSSYSLAPELRPTRAAIFPDSLAARLDEPIVPAPPIEVLIEELDLRAAPLAVQERREERDASEEEEEREEDEVDVPFLASDQFSPAGPTALVGDRPIRLEGSQFGWIVTRSDPWAQAAWYGARGYRAALLPAAWGGWTRPQVVLGQFATREAARAARAQLPPDVPAGARIVRLGPLPDGNAPPGAE